MGDGPKATTVAVAILAGGESRRMGRDKAALTVGGRTLLGRAAHVAADAGAALVLVIGRTRPPDWDGPASAVFVPDPPDRAGRGPLAGIVTALEEAADRPDLTGVIVVPCDLPHLTVAALRWLYAASPAGPGAAVDSMGVAALSADGTPDPLFALYRPAALPLLAGLHAAGERSPRRCIERGDFARVAVPPELRAALADADTPEEFARAVDEGGNGVGRGEHAPYLP